MLPSVRRSLPLVLVGLVVFFATAAGFRRAVPPVERSLVRAKFAEMDRSERAWSAVFLGNSRVLRHVDPARFDARVARAGGDLHSYNLGAPNMSFPEIDFIVRRLKSRAGGPPDWIFLDVDFRWHPRPKNFATRRVIEWHDVRSAGIALGLAMIRDGESPGVLPLVGAHLRAFAHWTTGRGLLSDRFTTAAGADPPPMAFVPERRGFDPLVPGVRAEDDRSRYFARVQPGWRRKVDRLRRDDPPRRDVSEARMNRLRDLVRSLRDGGVRVVLYVPPVVDGTLPLPDPAELDAAVLRFDDPEAFPELFLRENRWDRSHLNDAGAALFTNALADRFLELPGAIR